MLREGHTLKRVARFIQQERKEMLEYTERGVIGRLCDYRKSLPPAVRAAAVVPGQIARVLAEVTKRMDECAELQGVFALQIKRVERFAALEEADDKMNPGLGKEVEIAAALVVKHAQLRMDLGLVPKQLGQLQVSVGTTLQAMTPAERVMQSPESRHRVLGFVNRINALAAAGYDLEDEIRTLDAEGGGSSDEIVVEESPSSEGSP